MIFGFSWRKDSEKKFFVKNALLIRNLCKQLPVGHVANYNPFRNYLVSEYPPFEHHATPPRVAPGAESA